MPDPVDLTKLSDQDLEALASGDLSKVSDAGLDLLSGAKKTWYGLPKQEPLTSTAVNYRGRRTQDIERYLQLSDRKLSRPEAERAYDEATKADLEGRRDGREALFHFAEKGHEYRLKHGGKDFTARGYLETSPLGAAVTTPFHVVDAALKSGVESQDAIVDAARTGSVDQTLAALARHGFQYFPPVAALSGVSGALAEEEATAGGAEPFGPAKVVYGLGSKAMELPGRLGHTIGEAAGSESVGELATLLSWMGTARITGGAYGAFEKLKGKPEGPLPSLRPSTPTEPLPVLEQYRAAWEEQALPGTKILSGPMAGKTDLRTRSGDLALKPSELASAEDIARLRAETSLARHEAAGGVPEVSGRQMANMPVERPIPMDTGYGMELPRNIRPEAGRLPVRFREAEEPEAPRPSKTRLEPSETPEAPQVTPTSENAPEPATARPEPAMGRKKADLDLARDAGALPEEGALGVSFRSGEVQPRGTKGQPQEVREATAAQKAKVPDILEAISETVKDPKLDDALAKANTGDTKDTRLWLSTAVSDNDLRAIWKAVKEKVPDATPEDLSYALTGKSKVSKKTKGVTLGMGLGGAENLDVVGGLKKGVKAAGEFVSTKVRDVLSEVYDLGGAGEDLASTFARVASSRDALRGKTIVPVREAYEKLSFLDKQWLQDNLKAAQQGKVKGSPEVQDFVENYFIPAKEQLSRYYYEDLGGRVDDPVTGPRKPLLTTREHFPQVLSREARAGYEDPTSSFVKEFEAKNPTAGPVFSKEPTPASRWQTNRLKPFNPMTDQPRGFEFPEHHLERNQVKAAMDHLEALAQAAAEQEHLQFWDKATGQLSDPSGQGKFGTMLAQLAVERGGPVSQAVRQKLEAAIGRGGGLLPDELTSRRVAGAVNKVSGQGQMWFALKTAASQLVQGGLLPAYASNESVLKGTHEALSDLQSLYREGVAGGKIPTHHETMAAAEGSDYVLGVSKSRARDIGGKVLRAGTVPMTKAMQVFNTVAYGVAKQEAPQRFEAYRRGDASAANLLERNFLFGKDALERIKAGKETQADIDFFHRQFVHKVSSMGVPEELPDWVNRSNAGVRLLLNLKKGAISGANRAIRYPMNEAMQGRYGPAVKMIGSAVILSQGIDALFNHVFPPDKDELTWTQAASSGRLLEKASDVLQKSWLLGIIGDTAAAGGKFLSGGRWDPVQNLVTSPSTDMVYRGMNVLKKLLGGQNVDLEQLLKQSLGGVRLYDRLSKGPYGADLGLREQPKVELETK